jgi:CBS domain containing-hemolysin-like protein
VIATPALLAALVAAVGLAILAGTIASAEATLLRNLRGPPGNQEPAEVRDARAFPRASLTALWLCRDATLALAAAVGLLIAPNTPLTAASLVLLAWASSLIARKQAGRRSRPMRGRIWRVVQKLLPMARALRVLGHDVARRASPTTMEHLADEEEHIGRAHELDADELELLANVRSFGSRQVRDVMTPRVDMFWLPLGLTVPEVIHEVDEARFARIPIRRDDGEELAGILYAKDLLGKKISKDFDLESLLHPVELIAPETPVDVAFRELRERKTHLALVFDDLGSLIGLVTMEDLLEELFGEIRDEGDSAELPDYIRQGDSLIVSGRLPIQELGKILESPIETQGEPTTVGGLMMAEAGRIPRVAESVTIDGLRFTVERREGTVLRRVRVETAS